jgi:hypothetical protein
MRIRAIITLATGSQYYYRMALALMTSAHKFGGDKYKYIIFSDKEVIPYYNVPDWLEIVKLSERYFQNSSGQTSKGEGFRIKSMILSDQAITSYDTLFLDADCYIFRNCFDEIFETISQHSMAIYGNYLPEDELWGKINFQQVATSAGLKVRNMWLNSGFIGRAADNWGFLFIEKYQSMMNNYIFKPYIKSKFWQSADEPYLAAAFQIILQQKYNALPSHLPSISSDIYITTYQATLTISDPFHPLVHSNYIKGTFRPAIIHFLNGIDLPYYNRLINQTVSFNLKGTLLRPYFRGQYSIKKLKYFYKRLTNWSITESRDA